MSIEKPIVSISVDSPAENDYAISLDPAPCSTGILLSTLWSQSGIYKIGSNTAIRYNEYTPIDPSTGNHCVTGCTNTAAGQIIYYFIEKKNLSLTLSLVNSDEYTSSHDSVVIDIKADGSTNGTLSFAAVNAYLSGFQLNSAQHAAALVYACGVVQKANYSSSGTSTGWKTDLFYRSGFTSVNRGGPYWESRDYYWGGYENEKYYMSDAAFEVLIENLEAGRPVGTSYPGHALVIDGYDSSSDKFHINFGWGNSSSTGWYTREEMQAQQYYEFVYDLRTDYQETFTVTDSRLYGTGTLIRAIEQANGMKGDNKVVFTDGVAGKTVELSSYVTVSDDLVLEDASMNVLVTDSRSSWGYGLYAQSGTSAFNFSGGAMIVDTANKNNVAFYSKISCTVNADGALIYAGNYAVGGDHSAGAASVLQSLQTSRDSDSEVDNALLNSKSYSFYSSSADDVFTLSGSSIAVGQIVFGEGNDTLSVTDHSRLYGNVNVGAGNDTITVDSTSRIVGDLYNNADLKFVLTEKEEHPIFTVSQYVYNIVSYAAVSVNMTGAELGTYVLFSAAGASNPDSLRNLSVTVTGTGSADYALSVNGTSTSSFADLIYEDNALKFKVKSVSPIAPKVLSVTANTAALTNQDVILSASFSASAVTQQYSLDGKKWLPYQSSGVTVADNQTVYFRGLDAAGNISKVVSYTVSNIDKVPPEKPTVSADITQPANQNVTVSAVFSDDSVRKQYSRDNLNWNDYTAGIVMSENGTVHFRAIDAAGNVSDVVSCPVTNIDKTAPVKPSLHANITAPTNKNVTVFATFSEDSFRKQYSKNNSDWDDYTAGIMMSENGTVHFRGIDEAGNISEVVSYSVTNIDKTAPVKPAVSADITAPTNKNVTVSAVFSADSAQKQYSIDNSGWSAYTADVVMSQNGTVYFRAIDAAGNVSDVVSYSVTNIRKTGPDAPVVTASTAAPTNQDVILTAAYPDNTQTRQYSADGQTWQNYSAAITVTANGNWYFRGIDEVGNVSEVVSCSVTNIDKTAPAAPAATASITAATNQNVTVSATFSADSAQKQYSRDNTVWSAYTAGVVMSQNGTVYFRGIDEAGNVSSVQKYTVANIDKAAPAKPSGLKASSGNTTALVWNASADTGDSGIAGYQVRYGSSPRLSGDGVRTAGCSVTLSELRGGTWYAQVRALDAAGNVSDWSDTLQFEGAVANYTDGETITRTDTPVIGTLGRDGNLSDAFLLEMSTPGLYVLNGNFRSLKGTISIVSNKKTIASGTFQNGALVFNKGKPFLLENNAVSMIVVKTADQGKTADYSFQLSAKTLFNKGDSDSMTAPRKLGSVAAAGTLVSDGWVGYGDESDFISFSLDSAANLSLTFTATDAAKFTLINAATGKSVLSSNVKADGRITSKPKLLEAGRYCLQVQSTNAKKGGDADYTVTVNSSTIFFTNGDNSDDSMKSAKDLGAVAQTGNLFSDWVGCGDVYDFRKITLNSAAKLNFTVSAGDAVKFTLYNEAGKAVGNLSVKAGASADTKDLFLTAGTYYLSVQSTNAARGGSADYTVALNKNTVFFPAGDNSSDKWQDASGQKAKLAGEEITGWVGFGDAADFIKFQVAGDGQIKLDLDKDTAKALASKEIKLSCLDAKGKSVALASLDSDTLVSKKTVAAGQYYLGVTCANVKKFNSNYNITVGLLAS